MLPEIKIASPCSASWQSMTGDDRARHCSECNRTVYNFSEMTAAEIENLIAASNGERLCGRLYRRTDGTMLTRDCPVGLRTRIRRVSRRVGAALAAAISLACNAHVKAVPQDDSRKGNMTDNLMGDLAIAQSGLSVSVVHQQIPVAQANINVTDLRSHKIIATAKTDDAGRVRIDLTPADYRVLVEKPGLISQSVSVSVRPYEIQPLTVDLQNRTFFMGLVMLNPAQAKLKKIAPPVVRP
jgi:hypothetical protein